MDRHRAGRGDAILTTGGRIDAVADAISHNFHDARAQLKILGTCVRLRPPFGRKYNELEIRDRRGLTFYPGPPSPAPPFRPYGPPSRPERPSQIRPCRDNPPRPPK